MAVSFGLRAKRQKLATNATTNTFVEAEAAEALPPVLAPAEALAESEREQVC